MSISEATIDTELNKIEDSAAQDHRRDQGKPERREDLEETA